MSCPLEVARLKAIHDESNSDGYDEGHCHRCGGPNLPWSAPSPLWNEVMRCGDINGGPEPFSGIICPTCFMLLAQEAGIGSFWRLYATRVHRPLQTVTPSGRVWNEQTWKFEEPPKPSPTVGEHQ
ncbi:MAG TPA: hypothetical protein DGT23_31985 [Micromonosporaceae bacterium]|nr:hypothetical protein [Micromonosporaceae bacterium]